MDNANPEQNDVGSGGTSGKVTPGWSTLPTATKVLLGAVIAIVVLGALAFFL
jgi:hypothetical protein